MAATACISRFTLINGYSVPNMQMQYGNFTTEQFQELISFLPVLFDLMSEMTAQVESIPASRFDSVMTGDYGDYCHVYELPFAEHLALIGLALNRQDEFKEMAASPDPQEAALAMIRAHLHVDVKPHHEAFDKSSVMALAYSVGRTLQSMVSYGRSLSSLLQDVRDNNNQDSLFKAIRVDRTVIGCRSAMQMIARAQMRNDKAFFKHLRAALAGPSKRPMVALDRARYALLVLREFGVNNLSQKELEQLMVNKLDVYASSPSSGLNLVALYQSSKKIATI